KISIALMSDWEKKIDAMVKSTSKENVSNISGVPSWTLVLLQKIISQNNVKDITEIWPNLELFMHGGVNFQPYKNQFEQLIPTKTMNYY
ncbi:MAG: GH3 family domain-containing protein, partial [Flavobacteriales bacterium]